MTGLRNSQRREVHLAIEFTAAEQCHKSTASNLSLGGIFIESEVRLAFNTPVQHRFTISSQKEPIEVSGIVRWSDPGGSGVQFDGMRARDVWALGKFFEHPVAASRKGHGPQARMERPRPTHATRFAHRAVPRARGL